MKLKAKHIGCLAAFDKKGKLNVFENATVIKMASGNVGNDYRVMSIDCQVGLNAKKDGVMISTNGVLMAWVEYKNVRIV